MIGRDATNENLNNYGSYLPYDLLHICSHGGETEGYFVKQEFKDRDGKDHTIEYFEVVSFSLEGAMDPDKVKVERKIIFATFDGLPWLQKPLSLYPRYVGDDLIRALRDDDEVKRTPVSLPIAMSCHIKCYQSFHQGAFENLAAFVHPIIFNNSLFIVPRTCCRVSRGRCAMLYRDVVERWRRDGYEGSTVFL